MALADYFLRSLLLSLPGVLLIVLALGLWRVFFDPTQGTPNPDYYVLVNAVFGAVFSFLSVLAVAGRANRAMHYPILVRLPRRVEYLAAVLISTLAFATVLQLLVALLALWRGPRFTLLSLLWMPAVWLPANLWAAAMGLHTSDLVATGWSRVCFYGVVLACILGKQGSQPLINRVAGAVLWPFQTISDAIQAGAFTVPQALAPVLLALYAVVLWRLAAWLFSIKDLDLLE